jgi:serine/threonine protein kinase
VAIKKIEDKDDFEREKLNLRRIQNLNNRHLIKHIATCQRDSSYYVILPLANGGDLSDYWKLQNEKPRDSRLIRWSLQQMLGLAEAIRALHHDLGGDSHLRHGDLKPGNILFFKEDEEGFLVVADLGVSKVHEQPTGKRGCGTTTRATTRAYEAPEVVLELPEQPRARTYDIWSLGCVFLEFTIWLFYDINALDNFKKNRQSASNKDGSFYITAGHKADVSTEVSDAITALREAARNQGGNALEPLVDLIANHLLVVSLDARYNAQQLRDALRKILQDAEQSPPYLVNGSERSESRPTIFLPRLQSSDS